MTIPLSQRLSIGGGMSATSTSILRVCGRNLTRKRTIRVKCARIPAGTHSSSRSDGAVWCGLGLDRRKLNSAGVDSRPELPRGSFKTGCRYSLWSGLQNNRSSTLIIGKRTLISSSPSPHQINKIRHRHQHPPGPKHNQREPIPTPQNQDKKLKLDLFPQPPPLL